MIENELCDYQKLELSEIGSGGFGKVYKVFASSATNPNVRLCASKKFEPSNDNNKTEIKEIAELEGRFKQEAIIQYNLSKSFPQYIVPIIHLDLDNNPPSFFMELAHNNLRKMINSGVMDDSLKEKAVLDILNSVKIIHENNYLHRDIKPENILYFRDNRFKVSDFGLVKDLDQGRATIETNINIGPMGTGQYKDPDVTYNNAEFTIQSDIYSIGQVISDIYGGSSAPRPICEVISRCKQPFQDDRYENVDNLIVDFKSALTKIKG